MKTKIIRKLIGVEIQLGFLHIPASGIELMPEKNGKITAVIDRKSYDLTYNSTYKRIFGLTKWYKTNSVKVGDEVVIEKDGNKFILSFKGKIAESPVREAETLIDISGLSSQAKGNIVEERIKELIVLQGQGLLNVYRPVSDTQGIDLIVTKSGMFQPIFMQIKGRFNIEERGRFIMRVNKKTFTRHHSYFVIGAYFNPKRLEIDENILFIPSDEVANAPEVQTKQGKRYSITTTLGDSSRSRWAQYLIKKSELANKLIEKFEEIGKYIK